MVKIPTNYGNDITYSVNAIVDEVIDNLTKDTVTPLTSFKTNYFKMNINMCHQDEEVSANIEVGIIECSNLLSY